MVSTTNYPERITQLTAAYLETPTDPSLARLLGMAHLWQISERERQTTPDARITESAVLADRYLSDALKLEPSDARLLGFVGVTRLTLGSINQDAKLSTDGYLTIQDGIQAYPEFNLFVLAIGLGNLPAKSDRFNEGVEAIWKNFDVCVGATISRTPSAAQLESATQRFFERFNSGNTTIAPHNFEGFFLQWGDLLVKQGKSEVASRVYEQAKSIPSYAKWPFRGVLEDRLARLKTGGDTSFEPAASNSSFSCTMCHQGP